MKWANLLPDAAVKKVKQAHQAGIFSYRMVIQKVENEEEVIDFKDFDCWAKRPPRIIHSFKIRAYIYQARDLPASDAEGTSYPFIEIWDCGDKKKKTRCVEDTLNPQYYEAVELLYEVENKDDKETWPPFIFDFYDKDQQLMTNTVDFMGRAIVEPEDCSILMEEDLNGQNDDV